MGGAMGDCLARRRFPPLMESRMQNDSKRRGRDYSRRPESKAARLERKAARIAKAFRIGAAMPSPVYG